MGTAAIAQVNAYERLLSELAINPSLSLNKLYTVATQPDVTDEIAFLVRFRSARNRQIGFPRVEGTRVAKISLRNASSPKNPSIVQVVACVNVAGVKAFGPNGRSIVPKTRLPYYLTHLTLVNFKYPTDGPWLVRQVTTSEQRTCSVA